MLFHFRTGKISSPQILLGILILAAIFLETWNISKAPVEEWDEARRGINAISMINRGDYLHYYFLDQPDGFVNKPPLATWLISISFRLFGYNALALRLHSVVATIIFFFFSIKIIRLYKDLRFTMIAFSILITIKGIIGFHVGRTGDTDSLLVLFITAAIYYFLKYWDFDDKKSIYFSMIFAGLAFYSKGLAMMLMAPGMLGVITFSWKRKKLFNKHVLLSMALFIAIVASWYLLAVIGGKSSATDGKGVENLWQGLWQVDGVTRFFSRSFEGGYNPWFLFHVLDSYYNIWNYILYIGVVFFVVQWLRKKRISNIHGDRLFQISALLTAGLALILMLSYNKHRWYLAPGYLFLSAITAYFIEYLVMKKKWVIYLFIGLVGVTFTKRVVELSRNDTSIKNFLNDHVTQIHAADKILVTTEVRQNYILPFIFLNPGKAGLMKDQEIIPPEMNAIVLTSKNIPGTVTGQLSGYKLVVNNNDPNRE